MQPEARSLKPEARVIWRCAAMAWLLALAACGPPTLPAFANPPPEPDAGSDEDGGTAGRAAEDAQSPDEPD